MVKVTLVNYTPNAEDLLILAKSTRLNLNAERIAEIKAMSPEEKAAELEYVSKTVPSSWEFVDYTFLIEGVSRAFTHQLVRTRTGSYAQQAMRIVDMSTFDFVYDEAVKNDATAKAIIDDTNAAISQGYSELILRGYKPEVARGLLPTNIATNIMAKYNLRAFSQFVSSRLSPRVQPEMREAVRGMVEAVLAVHPWASKFIFPKGRDFYAEIENFAEGLEEGKRLELLKILDKMRGH